jgi:CO/xanthine dehydrogenase Mo-binding subunit
MSKENGYKYVGKPRPLVEGMEKVAGYSRYTPDVKLPGMLHAHLVLSPYAYAKIISIDKSEAEAIPGVTAVLTAVDLITRDKVIASRNSAILAKEYAYWCGQPVVAVLAESKAIAQDAAELVFVDYEPLEAVVDLEKAILAESPTIWPNGLPKEDSDLTSIHGATDKAEEEDKKGLNNVHAENNFARGDVEAGFKAADFILEDTFRTQIVHQTYMEPHGCVADPDPLGRGLTVYTATQGQFVVRDEVSRICDVPKSQVKVIPMTFGGGFGAKYGIYDPLVSALALTVKQPVRLFLSRSEDFLSTTPSPAIVIHLKTGVKNDGSLTAIQARVLLDNGIFSFNLSGIVAMLLAGYYKCDNVQIDCFEVNTHKPQVGAYRAPGAPQATFAIESHMDEIARRLNRDPLELRLQNCTGEGDPSGVGRPWPKMGLRNVLERMQTHPVWQNRTKEANVGYGLAVGGWPSGMGPASSICRVDSDGRVNIHLGTVDISGINSSFVLVAAEVLGVSPDEVNIVASDTGSSPFGPASGGSQVTYSVAGAVRNAAEAAKAKLLNVAAEEFEAAAEDIELVDSHAQVKGVPDKRLPIAQLVNIAQGKPGGGGPIVGEGSAAKEENAPGFVAHLVKIKVDPETGEIRVLDYIGVQDVGFAINPMMVEGQMHGGMVQGLGMALSEVMLYDETGQLLTGSFMDYAVPRFDTVPQIETIMVENPSPYGPFGARGIGEPPIIAGAAAVANAIKDATGVRLTSLPLQDKALWQKLQEA